MLGGFVPLNINIYHYCYTATISASATGDVVNYSILNPI